MACCLLIRRWFADAHSIVLPAPAFTLSDPARATEGETLSITIIGSSTGSTEAYSFTIDWDVDGTVDQTWNRPLEAEIGHVITQAGVFQAI